MRRPFSDLFDTTPDGSVTAKVTVRIGALTLAPGSAAPSTYQFDTFAFSEVVGRDLEVGLDDNVHVVALVY